MKKDNLTSFREEGSVPDVEIPGTKLGLKTLVEITRAVFGIYPKRISGDIVVSVDTPTKVGSAPVQQQARVTVYLTQGRSRSAGVRVDVPADDLELLVQSTAEAALGQVNPYVLAVHRYEHREYDKATEIVERIIRDQSQDLLHQSAACGLWGLASTPEGSMTKPIAKFQKAIELDPKYAPTYNNWGIVLYEQGEVRRSHRQIPEGHRARSEIRGLLTTTGATCSTSRESTTKPSPNTRRPSSSIRKTRLLTTTGAVVLSEQKKYDEAIARLSPWGWRAGTASG